MGRNTSRRIVEVIEHVAPYTGAWVETCNLSNTTGAVTRRTLYRCVGRNHPSNHQKKVATVAPYTGAWVETLG